MRIVCYRQFHTKTIIVRNEGVVAIGGQVKAPGQEESESSRVFYLNSKPPLKFEYGPSDATHTPEFDAIYVEQAKSLFITNNMDSAEEEGFKSYLVAQSPTGPTFEEIKLPPPPFESTGWAYTSSIMCRGVKRYPYNLFANERLERFKGNRETSDDNPLLPNFMLYFMVFTNGGELALIQCHYVNKELGSIQPHLELAMRKDVSAIPKDLPKFNPAVQPKIEPPRTIAAQQAEGTVAQNSGAITNPAPASNPPQPTIQPPKPIVPIQSGGLFGQRGGVILNETNPPAPNPDKPQPIIATPPAVNPPKPVNPQDQVPDVLKKLYRLIPLLTKVLDAPYQGLSNNTGTLKEFDLIGQEIEDIEKTLKKEQHKLDEGSQDRITYLKGTEVQLRNVRKVIESLSAGSRGNSEEIQAFFMNTIEARLDNLRFDIKMLEIIGHHIQEQVRSEKHRSSQQNDGDEANRDVNDEITKVLEQKRKAFDTRFVSERDGPLRLSKRSSHGIRFEISEIEDSEADDFSENEENVEVDTRKNEDELYMESRKYPYVLDDLEIQHIQGKLDQFLKQG